MSGEARQNFPNYRHRWAYCVTTVPERLGVTFERTIDSLAAAGFDRPHVFADGCDNPSRYTGPAGAESVTCRWPRVRTAGNWVLSLYETYYRRPDAELFAVFQDDLLAVRNLRAYLDRCRLPPHGYFNLFTMDSNLNYVSGGDGWHPSNQLGRSALGLVFTRAAVIDLLSQRSLAERPCDLHRGWRAIDGGVVDAMKRSGYTEYVHSPSLLQHTGDVSAMGNHPHRPSKIWPGEKFDATTLL